MYGLNVSERIDDIVKRSGLSEDIVRRVQKAEIDSIVESLSRGERATLIGRATFIPEIRTRLTTGSLSKSEIKVKVTPSSTISRIMENKSEFKTEQVEPNNNIHLNQIGALI